MGTRAWLWALALVAALAAALHGATFLGAGPIDDDFIVHRYARNLVRGDGLRFNPGGEVVEGFTSPLWLGFAVLGRVVHANAVLWSQTLGLSAAAAAAGLIAASASRLGVDRRVPVAGLLVAASPAIAYHACAGLGTTLLAACLAGWLYSWQRADVAGRSPTGAGLWLAAACLVRQEAAIFLLPFAAVLLRRGGIGAILPSVIAMGAWTTFRLAVFGAWLPNTWAIKRLPWVDEVEYGVRYLGYATEHGLVIPLLLGALVACFDRRLAAPLRAAAFGAVLHALYVVRVGGDWMPYARFFVPTLPLMILASWATLRRRVKPHVAVASALALGVALQVGQREHRNLLLEHDVFEQRWLELGDWFGDQVATGHEVALSPIGAFGWSSDLPILDLLGLTHTGFVDRPPDLERIVLKGHHRHDADWVLARRPAYVILGNGILHPPEDQLHVNPWEHDLVLDPRFSAEWRQVRADVAGRPVDYFRRIDAPPLEGERAR